MGGKKSTTVVDGAMSEQQYRTLSDNQKNIAGSIDQGHEDARNRFNTLDTSIGGLRTDLGNVGNNVSSGFMSLENMVEAQNQANQMGLSNLGQTINQSTGQIQSGMQTGFANVDRSLDRGFGNMDDNFDDVNQRFDRVDDAQSEAQSAIDTGFQAQNNAFNDLGTQMRDGFTDVNETAGQGFAAVGQSLSDLDNNTQNRLDNVQNNVLTGQALLDQGIGQVRDRQDVYYDDLAQRQQSIEQGQDQFLTNFDDYVQRYSDDTALANQSRSDLALGLEQGVNRIRDQVARTQQANDQFTAQQQGFMEQQFDSLINELGPETIVRNRDLAAMAAGNTNLDPGLRQNFAMIGQSFDDNGNVIMSSIDASGNSVARNIDNAGNLNIRIYDPRGQIANERSINLLQAYAALPNSDLPAA